MGGQAAELVQEALKRDLGIESVGSDIVGAQGGHENIETGAVEVRMELVNGGSVVKEGGTGERKAQRKGIGEDLLEAGRVVKEIQGANKGGRGGGGGGCRDEKAGHLWC